MKRTMTWMYGLLIFTCAAVAADQPVVVYRLLDGKKADSFDLQAFRQKADVTKVVPHLSANQEFKSSLTIRNDSERPISITMDFYDVDGRLVLAEFYDSDGVTREGTTLVLELAGFEVFSIDFDRLEGNRRSFQLFAVSAEEQRVYRLESYYNRYSGIIRTATVGVQVQPTFISFLMNLDRRSEFLSGNLTFRGLAVTNASDRDCSCTIDLYDNGPNGANVEGFLARVNLQMEPRAKWVGTDIDLFPDIDVFLQRGFGYLFVQCDNPVSAIGLAFEENVPVMGSVPVDNTDLFFYNKRGVDSEMRSP